MSESKRGERYFVVTYEYASQSRFTHVVVKAETSGEAIRKFMTQEQAHLRSGVRSITADFAGFRIIE